MENGMQRVRISVEKMLASGCPIFDVRSPSEYLQGHIPSAINIPLLSDDSRAIVGKVYKEQGPAEAYMKGLELSGADMSRLIRLAREFSKGHACIYCWRGGLRSTIFATLLEWSGIQVSVLEGGYKTFRKWSLETFHRPFQLHIVAGMTGTGKTDWLHTQAKQGIQIIDLEELACHRGSAFGSYPGRQQPTNEHFENKLAVALHHLNPSKVLWIEDESRMIGTCKIPDAFYRQMQSAPFFELTASYEERMKRILKEYGVLPLQNLLMAVHRLQKKLGGMRTKTIVEALQKNDKESAACLLIEYYDTLYKLSMAKKRMPLSRLYTQETSKISFGPRESSRD